MTAQLAEPAPEQSNDVQWGRVRERLRAEVGEDIFSSWFARLELERIDGDTVHMTVPTRFLRSWIQSHYAEKLLACWQSEAADGGADRRRHALGRDPPRGHRPAETGGAAP